MAEYSKSTADKKVILDLSINSKDAIEAIVAAQEEMEKLALRKKELDTLMKYGQGTQEMKKELVLLKTEMKDLGTVIKANEKELTENVKAYKQSGDSLNAMRAQLKLLNQQYADLSKAERESAKGTDLLNKIKSLTTEVKDLEQNTGDFRRSVGSYGVIFDSTAEKMQQFGNLFTSVFGSNSIIGKAASTVIGFGKGLTELSKNMDNVTDSAKTMGQSTTIATGDVQNLSNASDTARTVVKGFAGAEQDASTATEAMNTATAKSGGALSVLSKGFGTAAKAVGALGKQLLVLMANPIVLTIAAIVAIVAKLVQQFKKNDEAMTALNRAFAAFKPILDIVNKLFQQLVGVVTKVITVIADGVNAFMSWIPGLREYAQAENDIVVATDNLEESQRNYTLNHAKRESQISELRNKSLESEKYTVEQRREFLEEALRLEKEDIEEKRANAQEELRIAREKALAEMGYTEMTEEAWKNLSDEVKNNLTQLEAGVVALDAEFNNATRRMTSQLNSFDKEVNKEREEQSKKAAEAAKERVKLEKEALQTLEDLTIESMKDLQAKEEAQTRVKYERDIEKLKDRLKTESNLSQTARKAINDQIVLMESNLQVKLGEIAKKYSEDRLKTQLAQTKQYYEEVLKTATGDRAIEYQQILSNMVFDAEIKALKERKQYLFSILDEVSEETAQSIARETQNIDAIVEALDKNKSIAAKKIALEGQNAIDTLKQANEQLINDIQDNRLLGIYYNNEVEKTKIFEQQARNRLAIAEKEKLRLESYTEEEQIAAYGSIEKYQNAVLAAENNVVLAQNEVAEAVRNTNEVLKQQQIDAIETFKSVADATAGMMGGLQSLFETMAESDEKYSKYAKALAMTQILINTATSISSAVQAAVNAGGFTGPAAPITIPTFIAELVGIVSSSIASAMSILKKAESPSKPKFYTGGMIGSPVNKPDTPADDKVSILVSPGEFIMSRSAVNKYGVGFFEELNGGKGDNTLKFYRGGSTPSMSTIKTTDDMFNYNLFREIISEIQPVVSVREINSVQHRVQVKENISTI